MTDNLEVARKQATGITAALEGDASAMQRMALEGDPAATRKLAIALLHANNSITALIAEVRDLRSEVDTLRRRNR